MLSAVGLVYLPSVVCCVLYRCVLCIERPSGRCDVHRSRREDRSLRAHRTRRTRLRLGHGSMGTFQTASGIMLLSRYFGLGVVTNETNDGTSITVDCYSL